MEINKVELLREILYEFYFNNKSILTAEEKSACLKIILATRNIKESRNGKR